MQPNNIHLAFVYQFSLAIVAQSIQMCDSVEYFWIYLAQYTRWLTRSY
jgi:hypothetical protein